MNLPDLPSIFEMAEERERKKKEGFVVRSSVLNQGYLEYEMERAQNLVPYEPAERESETYTSPAAAVQAIQAGLNNSELQKDPAWYSRMGSSILESGPFGMAMDIAEKFKYIDIPVELGIEALTDWMPQKQTWLKGEAEREPFESWKALYGGAEQEEDWHLLFSTPVPGMIPPWMGKHIRDMQEGKALGSVLSDIGEEGMERMNAAPAAFEKRPLKAQLVLMALPIIMTGGTYAGARLAATGGSAATRTFGRILAGTSRVIGYDVADPLFRGIGSGIRATFRKGRGAAVGDDVYDAANIVGGSGTPTRKVSGSAPKYWRDRKRRREIIELDAMQRRGVLGTEIFPDAPYYGLSGSTTEGIHVVEPSAMPGYEGQLSPVHATYNEFTALLHALTREVLPATAQGIKRGQGVMKYTYLERSRDASLIKLQHAMAWRPGMIAKAKYQDLYDFAYGNTSSMRIGGGPGTRSGDVFAMDNLESKFLAQNYLDVLETQGIKMKKNDLVFKLAEDSGSDKAMADLPNRIIKKYRDVGAGGDMVNGYFLTDDARHIRHLKATEMLHEGYPIGYISRMLGHADMATTRTYFMDTAIDARTKKALVDQYRYGVEEWRALGGQVGDEDYAPVLLSLKALKDEIEELKKLYPEDTKDLKKAKSLLVDGHQLNLTAAAVAVPYRKLMWDIDGAPSDLLIQNVDAQYLDAFNTFVAQTDNAAYTTDIEVLKELLELDALRNIAEMQHEAFDTLDFVRHTLFINEKSTPYQPGASRPFGDKVWSDGKRQNTSRPTEGLLNRAGFSDWLPPGMSSAERAKWTNRVHFVDSEGNRAAREKFGIEYGYKYKTDEEWQKWADEVYSQKINIDFELKATQGAPGMYGLGKYFGQVGKKHSGQYFESLEYYVDFARQGISSRYASAFARYGETQPLYNLMDDILKTGSRSSGTRYSISGGGPKAGQYSKEMIIARRELDRVASDSAFLDPVVRPEARKINAQVGGSSVPIKPFMVKSSKEQVAAIKAWLGSPQVNIRMRTHKFHTDMSMQRFTEKIKTMMGDAPQLFGFGFQQLSKVERGEFLTKLVGQIYEKKLHLDSKLFTHGMNVGAEEAWKAKRMRPLRPLLPLAGVRTVYGVGSVSGRIPGHVKTMEQTVPMVWRTPKVVDNFFNNSKWGKRVRPIAAPLGSAVMGGSGWIARPITKYLSARKYLYEQADFNGESASQVVENIINHKSNGLIKEGIKGRANTGRWNDLTTIQKAIGMERGLEFFNGIKVLDASTILRNEQDLLGVGGRGMDTYSKLSSRLGDPKLDVPLAPNAVHSSSRRYLTQADIILERIAPDEWKYYFDMTPEQENALLYIKDIIDQTDYYAVQRGVDVAGRAAQEGGEYLTVNYFPRIFENAREHVARLSVTREADVMQNNFAFMFNERNTKDIIDSILPTRTGQAQSWNRSITASVSDRVGVYVSTMWKEVIDTDARRIITDSVEYKGARKEVSHIQGVNRAIEAAEYVAESKFRGHKKYTQLVRGVRQRRTEHDKSSLNQEAWRKEAIEEAVASGELPHYMVKLAYDTDSGMDWAERNITTIRKDLEWRREQNRELTVNKYMHKVDTDGWMGGIIERMSAEDQKAVVNIMTRNADNFVSGAMLKVANLAEPVSAIFRTLKSSFDLGAPMIHGFNSLVRLPIFGGRTHGGGIKGWAKGVGQQYKNMWNPDTYRQWRVDNFEALQEASQFVRIGSAEPISLRDTTRFYARLRKNTARIDSKYALKLGKWRVADRFDNAFKSTLDAMRLQMWESMAPAIKRDLERVGLDPKNFDDRNVRKAFQDLGDIINKQTGAYNTSLAQLTPMQQALESNLFFFAPMYRRSSYAIIADLFRIMPHKQDKTGKVINRGIKAKEAFNQLAGIVSAGYGMAQLAETLGNEGAMDLEQSYKFGRFTALGVRMGIGTAFWAAFRLGADIGVVLADDPDALWNPEDWNNHPVVHNLKRKGRSQLAPAGSIALDMFTGRTFIGDPLRDPEDGSWNSMEALRLNAEYLGKQWFPFWADGAITTNLVSIAPAVTTEFLGISSYEIQEYDRLMTHRVEALNTWDEYAVAEEKKRQLELFGEVTWQKAPKSIRDIIDEHHPAVSQAYTDYFEEYGVMAQGDSRDMFKYSKMKADNDVGVYKYMAEQAIHFEHGNIDGRDLNNVMRTAFQVRRTFNQGLLGGEFKGLANYFVDLRHNRWEDKEKYFQGDILFDHYMVEVILHEDNQDDEGMFLPEVFERRKIEWQDTLNVSDDMMDYIDDRRVAWLDKVPVFKQFYEDKQKLDPYWNIADSLFAPGSPMSIAAGEYLEMPRAQKNAVTGLHAEVAKIIDVARMRMREQRADIDWILSKYDFATPLSPYNKERHAQLIRVRDYKKRTGVHDTPAPIQYGVSPSGKASIMSMAEARRQATVY